MVWMGITYYLKLYKNWIISILIFTVLFWLSMFLAYEWSMRLLDIDQPYLDFIALSLGHTLFIYLTATLFGIALVSLVKIFGFFRKKDFEILLEKTTHALKVQQQLAESLLKNNYALIDKQNCGVMTFENGKMLFANKWAKKIMTVNKGNCLPAPFTEQLRQAEHHLQSHKNYTAELTFSETPCTLHFFTIPHTTVTGVLIDNDTEIHKNRELKQDYDTIFEILSHIHNFDQNGDETELLEQVLNTTTRLYGLQTSFLGRYENKKIKIVFATGQNTQFPYVLARLDLTNTVQKKSALATAILTQRPYGYKNINAVPYYRNYISRGMKQPFLSCYAFPLIINDQVEGGVSFFSYDLNAFSKERVEHLKRLIQEICHNIQERRLRILTQKAIRHYEERLRNQILELEQSKKIMERQVNETSVMMNELMIAKDAAEEANRSKTAFLANISHELRTPLNAILGFSETMESETFGPIKNKQYAEYIRYISSSGKHLLSLINDILDLSRAEVGHQKLDTVPLHLKELVEDSVSIIKRYPEGDQRKINISIPKNLPILYADERSVKQILLNILSNAVKFTNANGIIDIDVKKKEENIIIDIKDNGIGIPADKIKNLFKPFSQVENIMTRTHQGTGLGLALVKRLMEMHHGSVQLKSEENRGTDVKLVFPINAPTNQQNGDNA